MVRKKRRRNQRLRGERILTVLNKNTIASIDTKARKLGLSRSATIRMILTKDLRRGEL